MNLTFHTEISEEQLQTLVTAQAAEMVKQLVVSKVKSYGEEYRIREHINELYGSTIRELIKRELANSDALREKVAAELTAKIRRELARAMKAGEKV